MKATNLNRVAKVGFIDWVSFNIRPIGGDRKVHVDIYPEPRGQKM
jgi:hypothetical protein